MAGLGESSSQIAALLFAAEVHNCLKDNMSCTTQLYVNGVHLQCRMFDISINFGHVFLLLLIEANLANTLNQKLSTPPPPPKERIVQDRKTGSVTCFTRVLGKVHIIVDT